VCERAGIPASSIVAEGFIGLAKATSGGLGLPNMPCAPFPKHPSIFSPPDLRAHVLETTLPAVIANLTQPVGGGAVRAVEPQPRDIVFAGDMDQVNAHFMAQEWGDGLPIVPPTIERVEAFLRHTSRAPDEVLGVLLADSRLATVWSVAVNGVMAGCKPEYMPVLVAAVEAMADPEYGVEHSGNTPGGETLLILNGPIIQRLGFNCTQGVMRDGFHANTSVGRFWRLYLRNVAGFLPHSTDKACFGNTWRVVVAENEEALARIGWRPLSAEQGFAAGDDTVTVSRYTGGGMASSLTGSTPEEILPYLADAVVRHTFWQIQFSVGTGYGKLRPLVMITPIIAEIIAQHGWSKDDVKRFLFEHARMPAWEFERLLRWMQKPFWNLTEQVAGGHIPADLYLASDDPDRLVPIVWSPDHFMVLVTGDPLRTSGYAFGHNGQLGFPVTKKIVSGPSSS